MANGTRGAPSLGERLPPGPAGLASAVLRQAVEDARAGTDAAVVWLASDHAAPWVLAAGVVVDVWRGMLLRRGLLTEGDYMPNHDFDLPVDDGGKLGKALIRYRKTAEFRRIVNALQGAVDACDGDLAAALGELRGTAAGDWLARRLAGD